MTELSSLMAPSLDPEQQEARLLRDLEILTGIKLKIRINNNRSTMLSVRKQAGVTHVSIHRMFVSAPSRVVQKLASYIDGRDREIAPEVRAYIETGLRDLNYSHQVKAHALQGQGQVYDLDQILREVNREYFANRAQVAITWFGDRRHRPRSRLTFGLYNEALKLVKIHRRLDSVAVPAYVVRFVVYHEVLHHVCPGYVDARGHNRIHHAEFKRRERLFREHDLAQAWIKKNQQKMFGG